MEPYLPATAQRSDPSPRALPSERALPRNSAGSAASLTLPLRPEAGRATSSVQLEAAISEIRTQLEHWATTTKNGLAELRSELLSVRLEHRFEQTLRNTHSRDEVTQGDSTRTCASPLADFGSLRLGSPEDTQRSGAAGGTFVCGDGSICADLANSNSRLEAVEAACHDLRLNVQEVTSIPEATERILKAEIKQEVGRLHDELVLGCAKVDKTAMDLDRVETLTTELTRRVETAEKALQEGRPEYLSEEVAAVHNRLQVAVRECDQSLSRADELHIALKEEMVQELARFRQNLQVESTKLDQTTLDLGRVEATNLQLARRLEEKELRLSEIQQAQQGQNVEASVVRNRLETAMRECDEQLSRADSFKALLQEEQAVRSAEQTKLLVRVEEVERSLEIALESQTMEFVKRLERLEGSRLETSALGGPPAPPPSQEKLRSEVQQDVESIRKELQHFKAEAGLTGIKRFSVDAAQIEEVTRRLDEDARSLAEVVSLQQRFEEMLGDHGNEFNKLWEFRAASAEEAVGLRQRFEEFTTPLAGLEQAQARVEAALVSMQARLEALESMQRSSMSEPDPEGELSTAGARTSALEELRRSLAATTGDVAVLARDLASVRDEHESAITGIGGLTENVARTAAMSIQCMQERFESKLTAKCAEFDRAAAAQRETLAVKASLIRTEVARLPRVTMSGGRGAAREEATPIKACDNPTVDFCAQVVGQLSAVESRIGSAEVALYDELRRVNGTLSTAVERLDIVQADITLDLRPRVSAVEAAVASQHCRAKPPSSATALTAAAAKSVSSGTSEPKLQQQVPSRTVEVPQRQASSPVLGRHGCGHQCEQRPVVEVPVHAERPQPSTARRNSQELKQTLEGIVCSVNQVLGALQTQHRPGEKHLAPSPSHSPAQRQSSAVAAAAAAVAAPASAAATTAHPRTPSVSPIRVHVETSGTPNRALPVVDLHQQRTTGSAVAVAGPQVGPQALRRERSPLRQQSSGPVLPIAGVRRPVPEQHHHERQMSSGGSPAIGHPREQSPARTPHHAREQRALSAVPGNSLTASGSSMVSTQSRDRSPLRNANDASNSTWDISPRACGSTWTGTTVDLMTSGSGAPPPRTQLDQEMAQRGLPLSARHGQQFQQHRSGAVSPASLGAVSPASGVAARAVAAAFAAPPPNAASGLRAHHLLGPAVTSNAGSNELHSAMQHNASAPALRAHQAIGPQVRSSPSNEPNPAGTTSNTLRL
mmetsp:Transcript_35519/g.70228  ORF Transcript_35519/g.70228 Transcript_35519/m.70228 type:complete len:1231 (-) Transcript_35519:108-3800(-)